MKLIDTWQNFRSHTLAHSDDMGGRTSLNSRSTIHNVRRECMSNSKTCILQKINILIFRKHGSCFSNMSNGTHNICIPRSKRKRHQKIYEAGVIKFYITTNMKVTDRTSSCCWTLQKMSHWKLTYCVLIIYWKVSAWNVYYSTKTGNTFNWNDSCSVIFTFIFV